MVSLVLQIARLFNLINKVTTVWLEIFEDYKFRGFRGSITNLQNFILEN